MSKLAIHIFNQSISDGKLPNKDIINDLGICWTGVADKKPFYNIDKPIYSSVEKELSNEEIKQSILSLSNNLFTVENKHPLLTVGDVYKPFDLLVKVRFKGNEKDAESYLIEQGYNDVTKYIENSIFEKGKFDAFKASELLKADGYVRISEPGRDEILVYKINNGIMSEVNNKSDTIALFKTMLKGHPKESILANELHKARASVKGIWEMLESVPYDLQMDTKTTTYLPFANGVAKITKGSLEVEMIKYEDLKLFLPVESMKHELKPIDMRNREIGNFEKFVSLLSTGHNREEISEKENYDIKAYCSAIGYDTNGFKDMTVNKAIIFSDDGADGTKTKGRRGKSLIMKALKKFRPSISNSGNEFDPNYRHKFANLKPYHRLFFLDELPKDFNFHALFSNISDGISVQPKGKEAVEVPHSHSPKFILGTNWIVPIKKDEDSLVARFAEYKLKRFFHSEYSPREHFNESFWDDWDKKEWQMFFEFMIYCSMVFLNEGLLEIEYSKEADNYLSYFSDSVVEEEMQRIMNEMETKTEFTVTDFLREHSKENLYKYKPIFNSRNSRDRINIWIEYHKSNWKYNTQWKKWENNSDMDNDKISVNDSESLPF